jgi:hypothetical protein
MPSPYYTERFKAIITPKGTHFNFPLYPTLHLPYSNSRKKRRELGAPLRRNTWFWIDDTDLDSKEVFSLMMLPFTMVDTGPKENQPVVTIPAH